MKGDQEFVKLARWGGKKKKVRIMRLIQDSPSGWCGWNIEWVGGAGERREVGSLAAKLAYGQMKKDLIP